MKRTKEERPPKPKRPDRTGRQRLAENIRQVRLAQGMSQEALAEAAEFHRTFVSQIERRKNNISIDNIERLARALGVDLAELLRR